MGLYQLSYGFGVFTALITALLPFDPLSNYFVTSLCFAAIAGLTTYAVITTSPARHSSAFAALVAAVIFLYPNLWAMRPEVITFSLLLLTMLTLRKTHQRSLVGLLALGGLLVSIAGLTHPLAGFIGVRLVTVTALEKRWRWLPLFTFYGFTAFFVALLYLPIILLDVQLWIDNFLGFFTREEPRGLLNIVGVLQNDLFRFVGWGAPLIFVYLHGSIQARGQVGFFFAREALFGLLFFITVVLGGGGAYYIYLLVFIIWRIDTFPFARTTRPRIAITLLALMPFWILYFPTFQSIENPRYGETVRAIMNRMDTYSERVERSTIWVSTRAGLPIIDETYSRVIANFVALGRYPAPIDVREDDEFLILNLIELDIIFDSYALPRDQFQIENLIPPVPGTLTFESLLRARLPDIGLWQVTLVRR